MGALIPNGNDAEVISQLNSAFCGQNLTKLRKHIHGKKDDLFDADRALHRVSHRLKICPTSGTKAKGRWYVFLRDLIGPDNQKKIMKGLRDAVNDWDRPSGKVRCVGIRFWARLEPGITNDYDVEVVADRADAHGQHWVTITLLCDHEIHPTLPGDPKTPPPDSGEAGPQHPLAPSPKKSAKKAVKKAAKTAVKKTARKKK
jgi:hypothetical protein